MARTALTAAFLAAIIIANLLTSNYGMVSALAPGLTVTAGTYAAGLTLSLRDALHERLRLGSLLALIVAGALLSAALGDGRIALASGVAFLIAEALDLTVYAAVRRRGPTLAVIASNLVGAIADTLLFLAIAGFPLTWPAVAGQVLVKAVWMTALFLAAREVARRAVPRERVVTPGA